MTARESAPLATEVVDMLRLEIAALFDGAFGPDAIRPDVDVFEGEDDLVEGFAFDSLDMVKVIALVEDMFDVSIGLMLNEDTPVTLTTLAAFIVRKNE